MDTKHTPGPWTYQAELSSGPKMTVTPIFAHGDVIGQGYTQTDARLMASAPDLLAACKAIEAHIKNGCSVAEGQIVRAQLQAAIAKATS